MSSSRFEETCLFCFYDSFVVQFVLYFYVKLGKVTVTWVPANGDQPQSVLLGEKFYGIFASAHSMSSCHILVVAQTFPQVPIYQKHMPSPTGGFWPSIYFVAH